MQTKLILICKADTASRPVTLALQCNSSLTLPWLDEYQRQQPTAHRAERLCHSSHTSSNMKKIGIKEKTHHLTLRINTRWTWLDPTLKQTQSVCYTTYFSNINFNIRFLLPHFSHKQLFSKFNLFNFIYKTALLP
jgi:hypothetical protein